MPFYAKALCTRVALLATLCSFLLLSGCEKSSSSSGGGTQPAAAASEGNHQHVAPSKNKTVETDREKAARVARQLASYLMPEASSNGAPADLEAAKAALKVQSVSWAKDPWGNPYAYVKTGDSTFEVYSLGPDGQPDSGDEIRP
ncbi:MAG: type II secretion system protein GspG [Myxococcota bacterium]|jgi:hypothetical protein|nr:type II secretion system protein GspG [Myxococcota bacterium]